jgi:hypothetical protein
MMVSNKKNKIIKNKNTKEYLLDILTAYIGGFLFVI